MPARSFELPAVVCAPMAGGASTVELAVAVAEAGGLGFLAGGYVSAEALAQQTSQVRARTDRPFGVNIFLVRETHVDEPALERYVASLEPDARRLETEVGTPVFDDDGFDEKVALLLADPAPVVSFTFGCPAASTVGALQAVGSQVWVTVATLGDARLAAASGCDALVVQGIEAGGHRAAFDDDLGEAACDTISLVREVAMRTSLPLIAAGGIATASHAWQALEAGATSIQAGTAFLLTPEAGTSALHRAMIGSDRPTRLTRAFSGRTARGIDNAFMRRHPDAPIAYPQIHHATSPIRAAARAANDPESVNLWAGTRHGEARAVAAADVVRALQPG